MFAVLLCLVMPVIVFGAVGSLVSFSIHYEQPVLCFFGLFCILAAVIAGSFVAIQAFRKRWHGESLKDPSWHLFLAFSLLLAFLLASVLGTINYYNNTRPFCEVMNLSTYPAVDVTTWSGQQVMDAGRVTFLRETKVDLTRSMAFKNLDQYCVAPLVSSNSSKEQGTYDFWAIGMNCCSGNSNDFHCGEYKNPNAHSGLREVREDMWEFYRLAVQQAEATYYLSAPHPIFVYWMQDPEHELKGYRDEAVAYLLSSLVMYLGLQIFLTVIAVVVFGKLGIA